MAGTSSVFRNITGDDFVMIEHEDAKASQGIGNDTDHLDSISDYVNSVSSSLRTVSLEIHDNPELQYKEHHAHKVLTEFMKGQDGWEVTLSAYGIETAFVAVYDSNRKGATVSFNAEYGRHRPSQLRSG